MINQDGTFEIYRIQHRWKDKEEWVYSKENQEFFPATHECWQETGIHGTYELDEAKEAFGKTVAKLDPNRTFRLVKVIITQETLVI